ncbi:DUF6069 family protein [Halorubellus salinus]|uniref:DUF6069 family protein n=1 Tax=Halorubellus salinus TaxID=755309 RepID=UPI001D05E413|nr:DUF6069 family protein [Halorubellus salinus]
MSVSSRVVASVEGVATKPFRVRVAVAAVAASVANLLVLAVALLLELAPGFRPLAPAPIVFLTVLGVVGADAVYAFLDQRTDAGHDLFRTVALAVLVVSFVPDFALLALDPAATTLGVLALVVMHVVVAAICLAFVPGDAPKIPV